ncbi:unnamed protein product [Ambrosiozyma monospora]|uniref:Unnamed protein product n=1 Tax=Ambrosiozyma monospora TaxID=43982 RepID=A0A9W6YKU0_AMBMO|nr:unnamed protein product [Ambrosiozyma monospora]
MKWDIVLHCLGLSINNDHEIIKAKDHASVQINVAKVDEEGKAIPDQYTSYALCGYIRSRGEADDSLNRLAQQDGLLKNVWSYSR